MVGLKGVYMSKEKIYARMLESDHGGIESLTRPTTWTSALLS